MDHNKRSPQWAAGYVSAKGSLFMFQGRPSYRLKETTDPEMLELLKYHAMLDSNIKELKPNQEGNHTFYIQVTGKPLHAMMRQLWPYLSRRRRAEYAALRRGMSQPVSGISQ